MQDLSHLANKGWPNYGASMAAGSTIDNEVPWGKAPGTESEQTEPAAQGVPHLGTVSPGLHTSAGADDECVTGNRQGSTGSAAAAAMNWKTVK